MQKLALAFLFASLAACSGSPGETTANDPTAGTETAGTTAASETGSTPPATTQEPTTTSTDTAVETQSSGGDTTSGTVGTATDSTTGTSGSETTGEGFCQAHDDCRRGEVCVQQCTDDCDQSMFPNPCCERFCTAFSPLSCEAAGGTCESPCLRGQYAVANPEVWACDNFGTCCFVEVPFCEEHSDRFMCESKGDCEWVLADCRIVNCDTPDKGLCQTK
ncbi:hypothetical protein OV203_12650 [Nannocystis sp. ILAH1]|uniref:hypothetical protein n=1 Tax=unclassified Nannocystis TaxID=2627009 RepID=UPI002271AE22|nr:MULTISPECIES: hypothetical protein [unclassified Nannocystis]MCY0987980.1 hypothetical protein [Nannocystis sp. ILAH1]MCY1065677.1 hypothetical protein [Nannocystis sp. RBIL2]